MVSRWIVSFILIYDVHGNVESRRVSRLFSIVARSRPARATVTLSNLTGYFDSREIPRDPFLKIQRSLQKQCLII